MDPLSPTDPALQAPATRGRLERLVLLARRTRRDARRGQRQAGRGIEPGALRPYTPGDDLRRVDWAAYARLEQLLVKVPEVQPPSRLVVVIDASASLRHGSPPPFARARLSAAGLCVAALARGVRVDVLWGTHRLRLSQASELGRLLRFVGTPPPPGAAFPGVATLGGTGRGDVRLIADGLAPQELVDAARLARAKGFTASVLVIQAQAEAEEVVRQAASQAARVQLVDAETGKVRWARRPSWADAARSRRAREDEAALLLDRARVRCTRLRPDEPFEAPALQWLSENA